MTPDILRSCRAIDFSLQELRVKKARLLVDLKTYVGTKSAAAVAREIGITPAYLGDVLHGRREISDALVEKIGDTK